MDKEEAREALKALLWELPAEFDSPRDRSQGSRQQFSVVKKSSVRRVHDALWTLQEYFELGDGPGPSL